MPCKPRDRPPIEPKKWGSTASLSDGWESDIVSYEEDSTKHNGRGEIHFGWVLEGRAIQDVWMIPRRAERRPGMPAMPVAGNWYGTTLRVYDPGLDAWHILWSDPATQVYTRQIGRARGADIVQEGKLPTALYFAGASPRSRPIRSIGSANIRRMTARPGDFRSRCLRAASLCLSGPSRRYAGHTGKTRYATNSTLCETA